MQTAMLFLFTFVLLRCVKSVPLIFESIVATAKQTVLQNES